MCLLSSSAFVFSLRTSFAGALVRLAKMRWPEIIGNDTDTIVFSAYETKSQVHAESKVRFAGF
jgi:hypothetical protein